MKLTTICLICYILFYANLNAQSSYFKVTESEKFIDKNKSTVVEAVYTTGDNETAIARSSLRNLTFEIFSNDAKMIFNFEAELSRKESVVGELFYDNKLKIFTVYSPSKTERIINCHTLSINDKKYEKIELYSTTVEKKQSLFSGQNKRQTNLAISQNETFFAIATDNIKKHSNSYLIHVFDAKTLKLLYTKKYYTNTEKFFRSNDMIIDDKGTIYSLGKEYKKGKREKKGNSANYSFVLSKINENDILTKQIDIEEEEHIEGLRIILKDGAMNLIGFYSEKNVSDIKGVTQIKVDIKSLSILARNSIALPEKVYEDLYGYRKATAKSKKELRSFYLDHFLEDDFGNLYMLAEEFFVTQTYVSNGMNGGGYWVTTFHYDDILILKFNKESDLEWGRSIFKRSGKPSYNALIVGDKLHVLLNSGKNLKEKKDGRVKTSKKWLESTSLYDFVYDSEGNITREKIQDNKGKTRYIPYLGNYSNGKFIMFNHSRNNKQLMILESK